MRPDEHKKRKNTQYKKKHGLTTQGNKTEGKTKQENVKKSQDNQKIAKKREDTTITKSHPVSAAASSGFDEEEEHERQFSRRKLVSNWSRYDDIPSDDDSDLPSQRGEDFNKLLAAAGGSAAQFRFKDEDWNEESREVTPAVLSLDLDSIAESLGCVPLHERLGISSDLLSVEQIAEVSAAAADCQAKYNQKYPSVKPTVTNNGDKGTASNNCDILEKKSDGVHDNSGRNSRKDDPTSSNKDLAQCAMEKNKTVVGCEKDLKTMKHSVLTSCDDDINLQSGKSAKDGHVKQSSEIASLEDDLDMLLGLDDGEGKAVDNSTVVNNEDLIDNKPTEVNTKTKVESSTKEGKGIDKKADENLEDWLDSMLDD